MKFHLIRNENIAAKEGLLLSALACVKDPFKKGAASTLKEFFEKYKKYPEYACKKCLEIARKRSNNA